MKINKLFLVTFFLFISVSSLHALPEPEIRPDKEPPHHLPPHREICELRSIKTFDEVLLLMQKRLSVMHEVARWKWNHGFPIEDLEREEQLTEVLVDRAACYGIPRAWARSFIQAQMDAAKLIQIHDFEVWTREGQGCFEQTCDLKTEIRPYLTDISIELFEKLGLIFPFICDNFPCFRLVTTPLSHRECDAFPPHVWKRAIIPFCNCIHPGEKQ